MILDDEKVLNEQVVAHRNRVRAVYSTEEGKQELFNLILDCGLFDLLTPDRIAMRNFGIKKLMEIGLLDESVIKGLISKWLDSNPEFDEMKRIEAAKKKASEEFDVYSYRDS